MMELQEEIEQLDTDTSSVLGKRKTPSLPRRVGKWTREEEAYANYLINEFKEGRLRDCLENTNLRAYLSMKLNCKPMRITKKYTDNDYDGKLAYSPDPAEVPNSQQEKILFQKFIESITRPKKARSHKKRIVSASQSIDGGTTSSETRPTNEDDFLNAQVIDSLHAPPWAHHEEPIQGLNELDGHLTPEECEMLQEAFS